MTVERPQAILFDAGNTLVFAHRERLLDLYRAEGVDSDEDRLVAAELKARAELASSIRDGLRGTEPELWRQYFITLFQASGVPESLMGVVGKRLQEVHAKEHLWNWAEPGTAETLEALLQAGYRLGVISNADGRMEAVLTSAGLRPYLEFVVDSERVGFEKPDPRIFHEGLSRMEVEPHQALYVGDLYPVDVVGARGVGMDAVLLDPSGLLEWPAPRISSVHALPSWLDSRGDP